MTNPLGIPASRLVLLPMCLGCVARISDILGLHLRPSLFLDPRLQLAMGTKELALHPMRYEEVRSRLPFNASYELGVQ
jgi:hypothetical protein